MNSSYVYLPCRSRYNLYTIHTIFFNYNMLQSYNVFKINLMVLILFIGFFNTPMKSLFIKSLHKRHRLPYIQGFHRSMVNQKISLLIILCSCFIFILFSSVNFWKKLLFFNQLTYNPILMKITSKLISNSSLNKMMNLVDQNR